jgi:hypothetical protein
VAAAIQRSGMILGFVLAPALLGLGTMTALKIAGAVCLGGAFVAGAALVRGDAGARGSYLEPESPLVEASPS